MLSRVETNHKRAESKSAKVAVERQARDEALGLMRKAKEHESEVREEWEKEKKRNEELHREMSKVRETYQTEQAMAESLRMETEKLRKESSDRLAEVQRVSEILEKVEQEANITYKDCVAKFVQSPEFLEMVEEKAGEYHEIGYQDCLNFIGSGNVLDLVTHSITNFIDVEVARLEKESAEEEERKKLAVEEHEAEAREALRIEEEKKKVVAAEGKKFIEEAAQRAEEEKRRLEEEKKTKSSLEK